MLESQGLVVRKADPDDSRALLLAVTDRGARLARRAVVVVEAADAEFFAAAGDTGAALRLLRRLAG